VCLLLQDAGLLAVVAAAQVADVPSSLRAQPEVGARGGRRAPRKRLRGITPEHMLYWVLQADIAVQLRCGDSDGVVSMAQESDMPSKSDASAVLEAGDASAVLEAGDAAVAIFCRCRCQRQLKSR